MKQFSLEEYLKNPNRKVVTRDGHPVRIICTDHDNISYPIVGARKGYDFPFCFGEDGYVVGSKCNDANDLFFVPEKKVRWANIYRGKDEPVIGHIFNSEEEARESSRHCNSYTKDLYLGTAKIEWEEE